MKTPTKTFIRTAACGVIIAIGSLEAEPEVIVIDRTTIAEPVVVDPEAALPLGDSDPGDKATVKDAASEPLAATRFGGKVVIGQAQVVPDTEVNRRVILLTDLGAINTPDGPRISLSEEILFDYDKYDIKSEAAVELDKVAELIRLSGDYKVEVAGYADGDGSKYYNSDLAWQRSKAVVGWFTDQKAFPAAQFRAIGRGEEGEAAPNQKADGSDNPTGRALNRRVEILIRDQEERPQKDKALNPAE